jgi:hypothetical protein
VIQTKQSEVNPARMRVKLRCFSAESAMQQPRVKAAERPEPWVENEKGINPERAMQKTCSALSGLILILP